MKGCICDVGILTVCNLCAQEVFRRQVHPHGSLARQRASILMAEEAVEQALKDEKMRQRYTIMPHTNESTLHNHAAYN